MVIAPEKPHFMQPVLPGHTHNFMIPVAFFKYLNGNTCSNALLRSPRGGKLWPVKIRGRQVLNGWKEFADHLDLHVGDFLVFRHEGDLVFDVKVFDTSTCEKEYGRDDSMMNADQRNDCSELVEADATNENAVIRKRKRKKSGQSSTSIAKSSIFAGTVRPSYVSTLCLSRRFTVSNGLGSECSEIIVRDDSGKLWPMKLTFRGHDQRSLAKWRAFKEAHGLTNGDKFTLEVIKKGRKPVLQFHRLNKNIRNKVTKRKFKQKICKQVAASIAGQSPAPHFLGIVRLSNLYKAHFLIPREFTITSGSGLAKMQGETIISYSTEDLWVIMLRNHKHHRLYIGFRSRMFAIQNVTKVGDSYEMKLLMETERLPMRNYIML